jgi:6-pyruvoyltetrahydropterin/6-carboxytetrahydropterin synthase
MLYVTKRLTFAASHRLHNPDWDEEKNTRIFDKCNNKNGHGHNYVMEITIAGLPDTETGYVIDLKELKRIIKRELIDIVDHKHFNIDVDFMIGIIPSVENLAVKFWQQLEDKFGDGLKLHKIKLWETENNSVEYFGGDVEIKQFKIIP